MNRTKFIIIIIVSLINISIAFGQLSTSPYTIFGAGQISTSGAGANNAMGGAGIALATDRSLNILNPASFGRLDSLSFFYELGASFSYSKYSTSDLTDKTYDGNLSIVGLAFRVKSWWGVSAGVLPYSTVGYSINSSKYIDGSYTQYPINYEGSGGITKYYLTNAFSPVKNLSVGVNTSYLHGNITRSETVNELDNIGYLIEYKDKVSSLYADFGFQYFFHHGKLNYSIGGTYGRKKTMATDQEASLYYLTDTIDLNTDNTKFSIPQTIGIGIAVTNPDKLKIALDYKRQYWSKISLFTNPLLETRDSELLAFGMEYFPATRRNDPFWKKSFYRIGTNYNKTYLVIDDKPINSMSVSFGVGIPIRKELSIINLSFELGQMGTKSNGLIKENFGMIHLNFSMRDQWFRKYKYD